MVKGLFRAARIAAWHLVVAAAVVLVVVVADYVTFVARDVPVSPIVSVVDSGQAHSDPGPLYAIHASEARADEWFALIELGHVGALNDHRDDVIYAPVGTVADFAGGTVTVTVRGLARCEDGVAGECTGREFLGSEWVR